MSEQSYAKPPITEAVIDIQFDAPVDNASVMKAVERFQKDYPLQEVVKNIEFQFEVDATNVQAAKARVDEKLVVFKRTSTDQAQIALLSAAALTVSQLAPYPGWDDFFDRFKRDWKEWKSAVGYRKIKRVGVRYINRLDIPASRGAVDLQAYLRFYVHVPDVVGAQEAFSALVEAALPSINGRLRINVASVKSPLIDHMSAMLDIDLIRLSDVPQNDAELLGYLSQTRSAKNSVFEACLTQASKDLFQK